MAEMLFYPVGSMIMTIVIFLSYYALRLKLDDDDVDDSHICHKYEMIEAWENMVDDEPSNDALCDLVNREIEFETVECPVLISYDYINGIFNYWTDQKESISYKMLIDIAREYSVKVGIKRVFLRDDDTASNDDTIKISRPSGPFSPPNIKVVNVTVKLNSFKYKGTLSGYVRSSDKKDECDDPPQISWNDWKSKNV